MCHVDHKTHGAHILLAIFSADRHKHCFEQKNIEWVDEENMRWTKMVDKDVMKIKKMDNEMDDWTMGPGFWFQLIRRSTGVRSRKVADSRQGSVCRSSSSLRCSPTVLLHHTTVYKDLDCATCRKHRLSCTFYIPGSWIRNPIVQCTVYI